MPPPLLRAGAAAAWLPSLSACLWPLSGGWPGPAAAEEVLSKQILSDPHAVPTDASQTAAAQAAAVALAAGGIPESSLGFDEDVVGPFGAGFALSERVAAEQEALATLADCHAAESDCDSEAGDFTKVGN